MMDDYMISIMRFTLGMFCTGPFFFKGNTYVKRGAFLVIVGKVFVLIKQDLLIHCAAVLRGPGLLPTDPSIHYPTL